MESITRVIGQIIVRRTPKGSGATYSAWEPVGEKTYTITDDGDAVRLGILGRVDTRRPDSLPDDDIQKISAATSWVQSQRDRGYDAIYRAFPEAREGMRCCGVIEILGDPEVIAARVETKKKGRS